MKNLKILIVCGMFAICLGLFAHFSLMFKDICYGEYDGSAIYISGGAKYTLSGGTVKNSKKADFGGGIFLGTDCTLIITGGTISGNSAATSGGGVYDKSTMNMSAGYIQNNSASYGGGVHIDPVGTFTFTGGTISGNSVSKNGGGININGILYLQGGTISSNKATSGNGGGINVGTGTATMSSGYVQSNSAAYGAGVYVTSDGTFTFSGGTISSNTVSSYGGGVYSAGTFNLKGGTIKSNKATGNSGGGIYLTSGTTTMSSGYVQSNSAKYGAGVYVSGGEFNFSGGTISDNTAEYSGGGFKVDGTANLKSGTLKGNSAQFGAGVACNGTFNMTGGTISGNTASTSGGGLYAWTTTNTMSSGYIQNNSASYGGAVYIDSRGAAFTMSGGTISGNTASTNGGGVYVGGTFNMTGGTISGNSDKNGSGVFVGSTGTFNYSGGTISDQIYLEADTSTLVLKKAPTSTLNIRLNYGIGYGGHGIVPTPMAISGTKVAKLSGITTLDLSKINLVYPPLVYAELKIEQIDNEYWVVVKDICVNVSATTQLIGSSYLPGTFMASFVWGDSVGSSSGGSGLTYVASVPKKDGGFYVRRETTTCISIGPGDSMYARDAYITLNITRGSLSSIICNGTALNVGDGVTYYDELTVAIVFLCQKSLTFIETRVYETNDNQQITKKELVYDNKKFYKEPVKDDKVA